MTFDRIKVVRSEERNYKEVKGKLEKEIEERLHNVIDPVIDDIEKEYGFLPCSINIDIREIGIVGEIYPIYKFVGVSAEVK